MSSWRRFSTIFLATAATLLAGVMTFVAAMDPWRVFPLLHTDAPHFIPKDSQRYLYPGLVRSNRYDAALIGNSTAMMLDPERLGRLIGDHFMNLAMAAALPWEQMEMTRLLMAADPPPRTILFTMNSIWCNPSAAPAPLDEARLPLFLYRPYPGLHLTRLFNVRTIGLSFRVLRHDLGFAPAEVRADGYLPFLPPDATYDGATARKSIYPRGPVDLSPVSPPEPVLLETSRSWRFGDVERLGELVARMPHATRVIFAFMPGHVASMGRPGSVEAAMEQTCKEAIARVAAARETSLIDFHIRSSVTLDDASYWDQLHYREPIARRIEAAIATALRTGQDDPDGFWRLVRAPSPQENEQISASPGAGRDLEPSPLRQ